MYRDIVLYNCTNELVQLLDKERDFMLKFILYMLLAVVILSGGIFKTFAINYGISKYLSKKPYKGDFEFKKVALHTLKTNYILLALVVLIVLGITLCSASSYINKGVTVWVQNLLKVDFANLFVINMYLLTAFVTVFRSFANLNFVN